MQLKYTKFNKNIMEVLPTIDEVVDGIVAEMNWPNYDQENGVDIGGLRAYKWPNWVELKHGTGQNQIIVQREFKNNQLWFLSKRLLLKIKNQISRLLKRQELWIVDFLDSADLSFEEYSLRTVHEAVKACLMKLDELDTQWIRGVTNARPW
jgi:hypothetical protein